MQYKNTFLVALVTFALSVSCASHAASTYVTLKGGYTKIHRQHSHMGLTARNFVEAGIDILSKHAPNFPDDPQKIEQEAQEVIKALNEAIFPAIAALGYDVGSIESKTEATFEKTFNVGATIGQKYGHARVEYEANFIRNKIDKVSTNLEITTADGKSRLNIGAASLKNTASGYIFDNMINGYFDFRPTHGIAPFIGAGLGVSFVKNAFAAEGVPKVTQSSAVFAYQAIAGLQFAVSKSFKILAEYKFTGRTRSKSLTTPITVSLPKRLFSNEGQGEFIQLQDGEQGSDTDMVVNITLPPQISSNHASDKLYTHSFNLGFTMIIA